MTKAINNSISPRTDAEERTDAGPESVPRTGKEEGQPAAIGQPDPAIGNNCGESQDPFDLSKLRLSQNFSSQIDVKKILTTVPCHKPNRHDFIRVRKGDDWRLETAVFEDKAARETYLVAPNLVGELAAEISPVCLFTVINRQGDIFLWPAKLPAADGRSNSWNDSALAAARIAEDKWIRVASNLNAGYYDPYAAIGVIDEPEWPNISFQELVRLCFKDCFIQDSDHPVLRSLRGEV